MAKSSKGRVARPVLDGDTERAVTSAIHAFYRIRRLAIRTVDELSADGGDGEFFCMAITDISELHGKELDDCMRRVTHAPGIGCFDKESIE
jgi:hypothetical protein